MSRRSLLFGIGAGMAVVMLVLSLGAWWLLGAGSFQVQVWGDDTPHLRFSVPLALLQAGLLAVPNEVMAGVRSELDCELGPWRAGIEKFCESLADCPDGDYVRVESGREYVRISKKRGDIVIFVEDGDERVRVKVPIKALGMLGSYLTDDL